MRAFSVRALVTCGLVTCSLSTALSGAGASDTSTSHKSEANAVHELLEGASGRRETWTDTPELVIISSVMEYAEEGLEAGYVATDELLQRNEIEELTADLTRSLEALTGGQRTSFLRVRTVAITPGQRAKIFQRGQIVVGRFKGLRGHTGTLGWGGRMTRHTGDITSAAVMLDREFDNDRRQRHLLRMHELAHALGYNHVESRASVMNPRVGSDFTEFDRQAVRLAYPRAQPPQTDQTIEPTLASR